MEIKLENLNLLESISNDIELIKKQLLNSSSKRWLSVKDLSEYLSYSSDRIYKLKDDVFIEGMHFYKKQGKILFDKYAIDKWITSSTYDAKEKVNQILKDLL
jgi:methylaspartate ammonia-lyase